MWAGYWESEVYADIIEQVPTALVRGIHTRELQVFVSRHPPSPVASNPALPAVVINAREDQ